MKIGDRIFVRGYIDEIRKDTVIVRNDGGYFGTVLSEVTGELPSAQPEQQWIPCSERLPEKYGQYLVTFIPSGGTLWTYVLIVRYSDLMGIAKPSFHVGTVGKNDFMNITEQVTAWMPLPEPYKAERREE